MYNTSYKTKRINHQRQSQSPTILKLKAAAKNSLSRSKLCPFNMNSWNQKRNYQPNDYQRRLKFQNDQVLDQIKSENGKIISVKGSIYRNYRSKTQAHTQSNCNYMEHYESIKRGSNRVIIISKEQQDLINLSSTPPVKQRFKEHHRLLWRKIFNTDHSLENFKNQRSFHVRSRKKEINKAYIQSKQTQINIRMQRILKKWKKGKNYLE